MSRRVLAILPLLLVSSPLACSDPAAPASAPARSGTVAPAPAASFDEIAPTDTTCRSGYNVSQGRTC